MNVELKALLDVCFDGLQLGEDAIHKSYFSLVGDLVKILGDLPAAANNFSDLQAEIAALTGKDQQADLIAYMEAKFKESPFNSEKAQVIISKALVVVQGAISEAQSVLDLVAAIKS